MATEAGIARFDGVRFTTFDAQNTPSIKSDDVSELLEDVRGRLWAGTDAGLIYFDGQTFQVFHGQGSPIQLDTDLLGRPSAPDGHGGLWVGSERGLEQRLSSGTQTKQQIGTSVEVRALLRDRNGVLWVGTGTGLMRLVDGQLQTAALRGDRLPGSRIDSLYQDREGAIWIGTDLGIARLVDGNVEALTGREAIPGSAVLSIVEDREGSMWLGTESGGVTTLRDQKFAAYGGAQGLTNDLVRCVYQDESGTTWVGTNGGGLSRWDGTAFSNFTTKDGLSSNVVLALASDPDGTVWAGTPDGLNRIRVKSGQAVKESIKVLTSADGLADDFIRSLFRDVDGSLWIGTRHGLTHLSRGQFVTYTETDGLASDLVGRVLRGRDGVLNISTLHGLSRFDGHRFVNLTARNGLSNEAITTLHEAADGALWIGTNGGGLNRYAAGKVVSIPANAGLPGVIYGLVEDRKGQFWISANRGIFRVSREELNGLAAKRRTSVSVTTFGTADGMAISECSNGGHPSSFVRSDGSLWFATLKGVAAINPDHVRVNQVAPLVAIESIAVNDRPVKPSDAQSLSPNQSRISFEYAGLSFLAPQKTHFRYRLEGLESTWTEAGTRRTAYYTNIPPGRYNFRVLASNNDGLWSDRGAEWSFRLQPHFYQTYWFYFALLCGVAATTYQLYRWRVRQVESQYEAVLAERNRIAREIHDTLAQGFVAVSVQLELIARLLPEAAHSAREQLQVARTLVSDGIAEARRSIWDLRLQRTDTDDFAARFSKMIKSVTGQTALQTELAVEGEYRPIPEAMESELLRIGQEALTNVVRHAEARHVRIVLKFRGRKFQMEIADDGCGFAQNGSGTFAPGHYGMRGMQERADQIHARLETRSEPGEGTTVTVETTIP